MGRVPEILGQVRSVQSTNLCLLEVPGAIERIWVLESDGPGSQPSRPLPHSRDWGSSLKPQSPRLLLCRMKSSELVLQIRKNPSALP